MKLIVVRRQVLVYLWRVYHVLFETKCLQQVVCEGVAVVRECNPVRLNLVNGEESTKEIRGLANAMPRLLDPFTNVYNSFS